MFSWSNCQKFSGSTCISIHQPCCLLKIPSEDQCAFSTCKIDRDPVRHLYGRLSNVLCVGVQIQCIGASRQLDGDAAALLSRGQAHAGFAAVSAAAALCWPVRLPRFLGLVLQTHQVQSKFDLMAPSVSLRLGTICVHSGCAHP